MERSDVIARSAADLRGMGDATDGRSDVASAAGQLKAHEPLLQLGRQLKLKWTGAGTSALLGGAYARLQLWFWDRPEKRARSGCAQIYPLILPDSSLAASVLIPRSRS